MNESDERFSSALRDLGAAAPEGAPLSIGIELRSSFRKRHLRRKRIRVVSSGVAIAACIAIVALLSFKGRGPIDNSSSELATIVSIPAPPGLPRDESSGAGIPAPAERRKPVRRRTTSVDVAQGFTPLPTYDPAFPANEYQIVRVGLQDTALSQLGLPVHENSSGQRVLADLLLDKDGLPLAVRFVGQQKMQ